MHTHNHTPESPQEHHARLAAEQASVEHKLLKTQGKIGAREVWRFAVSTAVIFLVAFVGLNYSAYEKNVQFWWKQEGRALTSDVLGIEIAAPAREVIVPETFVQEQDTTNSSTTPQTAHIPDISLGITPAENYLFLPRLDIRAPIAEADTIQYLGDWGYVEEQMQESLRHGVVRFPGTALPGEVGNAFITGHSSYYPWDTGRYKDIFALLPRAEVGDEIHIVYNQATHRYRITEMKEVLPTETDVLRQTDDARLTLMTCTPVGTALRRLIVTAELLEDTPPVATVAMTE